MDETMILPTAFRLDALGLRWEQLEPFSSVAAGGLALPVAAALWLLAGTRQHRGRPA